MSNPSRIVVFSNSGPSSKSPISDSSSPVFMNQASAPPKTPAAKKTSVKLASTRRLKSNIKKLVTHGQKSA